MSASKQYLSITKIIQTWMRTMDHMKTLKGCDNGANVSIARTYCYYLKLINKTILDPGLIMCHCSAVKLLRDVAFLASSKSSFFLQWRQNRTEQYKTFSICSWSLPTGGPLKIWKHRCIRKAEVSYIITVWKLVLTIMQQKKSKEIRLWNISYSIFWCKRQENWNILQSIRM
jgi:hypothetical protein